MKHFIRKGAFIRGKPLFTLLTLYTLASLLSHSERHQRRQHSRTVMTAILAAPGDNCRENSCNVVYHDELKKHVQYLFSYKMKVFSSKTKIRCILDGPPAFLEEKKPIL